MTMYRHLSKLALLPFLLMPHIVHAQSAQSQPTEESRKLPPGSSAERKARMHTRAMARSYSQHFDLSALPSYKPEEHLSGTLRICGNNYIGDSPLQALWTEAFAKFQPDIKLDFYLPTAAVAIPCLYFDKADIGANHEPSFYDYLSYLRLKGYEPTGISVLTGSYDYVGWQNNIAIITNKDNPLTKITMKQLDRIFGSRRAGGWIGTTWHPELARGPEGDIREWGQMGLTGPWANKHIDVFGYSIDYATSMEFSRKVLQASNKWNGDIEAFGNYRRPDGTTYLEADQIVDHVRADPNAIGYVRFHQNFPKDIKILAVAADDKGPFVNYTIENLQNRSYPLWDDQSFWVNVKPGTKMDPKVREFLRFVLSREGQEAVQEDGKYLPLDAKAVEGELKKVQ
jgi:phosphate transport system substrate-binding protein